MFYCYIEVFRCYIIVFTAIFSKSQLAIKESLIQYSLLDDDIGFLALNNFVDVYLN